MSEDSDYTPSSWSSSYDFSDSRDYYDSHRDTSYTEAKEDDTQTEDLIPESIQIDAESLLVIVSDLTGSMGKWPTTFFSKFPYLDYETKVYLGKNTQFLFAATEDAAYDYYPVQITEPTEGEDIGSQLKKLVHEHKAGGGNGRESYELLALYMARKVFMPNLKGKPILVFFADEAPYKKVNRTWAKEYLDINLNSDKDTEKIFEELKSKFSVYLVKKPYEHSRVDAMTAEDRRIYEEWVSLLGEDKILLLGDENRAVDVVFAILAKETDRIEYCIEEFDQRQGQDDDYEEKKRMFDIATRFIFAEYFEEKKVVKEENVQGKKMKKLV